MKDTDKVELTVGNIKAAADSCPRAKEVLKKLCPNVFEDEWVDCTRELKIIPGFWQGEIEITDGTFWIVKINLAEKTSEFSASNPRYKYSGKSIWRKK